MRLLLKGTPINVFLSVDKGQVRLGTDNLIVVVIIHNVNKEI